MTASVASPVASPASSPAAVIELVGVGMTFRPPDGGEPIIVLEDIDLSLVPGELLAVAGRSGSGKTTLLDIASGLCRPTSGGVWWFGRPLRELAGEAEDRLRRTRFGIVFQSGGLIASLTAAENVALALPSTRRSADARGHVLDCLDQVGLAARANHLPRQLSGGEQQRVAFARALCNDPAILIVDEPTANLDRRTADSVIEVLLALMDGTRAMLVASHDQHLLVGARRTMTLD